MVRCGGEALHGSQRRGSRRSAAGPRQLPPADGFPGRALAAHAGHPARRQHAGDHAGERIRLLALLREFRGFLEKRLFGDRWPPSPQLASKDLLLAWAAGRMAISRPFSKPPAISAWTRLGRAYDAFLSYGAYDLFPAGTWQGGQAAAFDPVAIDRGHCQRLAGRRAATSPGAG
jgi:hypothetical protein